MQTITEEQLAALNFYKFADFTFTPTGIGFSYSNSGNNKTGHVYFWLQNVNGTLSVVYVGKAGKTMEDRCKEHLSGFKGTSKSLAGMRHAENLRIGNNKDYSYHVYARKSDIKEVLGEQISIHSAEEEALIKKFSPPWNKRK